MKIRTIIILLVVISSCKKSSESERTISASYNVECDSCTITYKHKNDYSQVVYGHWYYSFSVITGDSVCLRATNLDTGSVKINVKIDVAKDFTDTTSIPNGSVSFREKF